MNVSDSQDGIIGREAMEFLEYYPQILVIIFKSCIK